MTQQTLERSDDKGSMATFILHTFIFRMYFFSDFEVIIYSK